MNISFEDTWSDNFLGAGDYVFYFEYLGTFKMQIISEGGEVWFLGDSYEHLYNIFQIQYQNL